MELGRVFLMEFKCLVNAFRYFKDYKTIELMFLEIAFYY